MPYKSYVKDNAIKPRVKIDEIDPDVVAEIAEAIPVCAAKPTARIFTDCGSVEEAEKFLSHGRAYVKSLEPRLTLTGNTTGSGQARWRVDPWEATSAAINDAAGQ